ncbi:dihydrodipicolinate synthase (plasmid) [Pseudonocardia sp. EC080610-09]|uniref:4-hydroxy-tetrahydrodipicolinate synthase n=1 Tax=unclassified Pseudonocardia TaxID=2619320 RepID=UPI000705E9D7|nr:MULTISPECIES: 4-hydroxy-tetrahydrodipicolinate synthase [unclassified Pseudonocardia]ALL79464.1 dihydrodipicolinate synthase [Pseudonocardia sp. EC080610-09]ALL85583.1 dihydrodipicolinate synthase [Pseudonocardia sp. EC080619-01]
MTIELRGVLTALATPFTADERVDVDRLRFLVDRSIEGGVDGVVACGSTGEFAALSTDERRLVVDTVVEHTAGRVPVVAQTGATSTAEAVRLSHQAKASGADVAMLVTPYYEPLSLEETTAYLREVAGAVELPVMLYNIPPATGVNLGPDTVGTLSRELDNVRYVKDSSANMEQALQLIHHHGDHVATFVGWDSLIHASLVEGAAGVLAGAANVVPAEIVAVYRAVRSGDAAAALAEWNRIYPVIDALISVPFLPAIKSALASLGHPIGAPRRPTAELTSEHAERIARLLAALEPASVTGGTEFGTADR